MNNRNKRLNPYMAVAIALMIGLTGCGASLADTGAMLMDEGKAVSETDRSDDAGMNEEGMPGAENAGMAEKGIPESENAGMKEEGMPEPENSRSDDAGMDKETMAVTYEKNFALMDLEGNTITLNDHEGKKVYVKFWGTWCSICLSGIDELEAFAAEQNAGADVSVITVVAPGVNGEFKTDEFKEWYGRNGYTFPVLFDEGGKVLQEFRIRSFPTSMIFEKDGRLSTNRPGHIGNEALRELLSSEQ